MRPDFDIPGHPVTSRKCPVCSAVRPTSGSGASIGVTARGDWMMTFTGRKFYCADPRPEDVDILDLAHQLARESRYGGATIDDYSVAEHSVIVSLYVPPHLARRALLHDGGEAYCKDMPRPTKKHPLLAGYEVVLDGCQAAVFERFGMPAVDAEADTAIKVIDDALVLDETRALMRYPDEFPSRHPGAKPLGARIAKLPWRHARHVFLQRFIELFPEEPAPVIDVWDGLTEGVAS